jgi:hypothetical protein
MRTFARYAQQRIEQSAMRVIHPRARQLSTLSLAQASEQTETTPERTLSRKMERQT